MNILGYRFYDLIKKLQELFIALRHYQERIILADGKTRVLPRLFISQRSDRKVTNGHRTKNKCGSPCFILPSVDTLVLGAIHALPCACNLIRCSILATTPAIVIPRPCRSVFERWINCFDPPAVARYLRPGSLPATGRPDPASAGGCR